MSLPRDLVELVVRKELPRIANWDSLTPERQAQYIKAATKIGTDGFKPNTSKRLTDLMRKFGLKDKSP